MPYPALPPEPPALVSASESVTPPCAPDAATAPPNQPPCAHAAQQLQPLHAQPFVAPLSQQPFSIPKTSEEVAQPAAENAESESPAADSPETNNLADPPTVEPNPSSNRERPPDAAKVLEVTSDRQDFDTLKKVLFAIGDVLLRFQEAELTADRIKTTVTDQQVVAEGKVKLTRGNQILQGERLEYNLAQNRGTFFKTSGTISFPTSDRDFSLDTPNTNTTGSTPLNPLSDPRQTDQSNVTSKSGTQTIRFTADRIEFSQGNWVATNIRITNDPFSPPELEIRANQAILTQVSPTEDRLQLKGARLVFDQKVSIPLLQPSVRIGQGRRDPLRVQVGFDDRDRGGLFVGGRFSPLSGDNLNLTITPQLFVQRLIDRKFDLTNPDVYGFTVGFGSRLGETTTFDAFLSFNTIDLTNLADRFRGRLRLQQQVGDHLLSLESAYRERTLSGSLGEQEVLSRNGAILTSPLYRLGKSGLDLNYQLSAEYITALTERADLNSPAGIGRFQGSIGLSRAFTLWTGKTLPPTATEGLRYTPEPVQPNLRLVTGLSSTTSTYTTGDTQATLVGSVRLEGQFGHFSRPAFDYTSFNLGYAQVLRSGTSPFAFDRVVDEKVLSAGILQHIYGPFRLGVQTSLNVDTGEFFNTDIILDYSRRTYGVTLRYTPEAESISLLFRIGGFNWVGNRGPLDSPEFGVVETGVQETNDSF
ncbi:MAG: DUF3769 domain-containing protein [Thermosynechococcaceae cyanobacterium]